MQTNQQGQEIEQWLSSGGVEKGITKESKGLGGGGAGRGSVQAKRGQ